MEKAAHGRGSMTKKRDKRRQHSRRFHISPITRRILAVNILALGILVAGLLYLDQYREELIHAEMASMEIQARMFAVALGETSVTANDPIGEELLFETARQMVWRLAETTGVRARLFAADGVLAVDSRRFGGLSGPGGMVQVERLPPPDPKSDFWIKIFKIYDYLVDMLPGQKELPAYNESVLQWAGDYPEVASVLEGRFASVGMQRRVFGDGLMLSVAAPVLHFKQVLGAILVTKTSGEIEKAMLQVRLNILKVFGVSLLVTILLSLYLASSIAHPVSRLAAAAERVRRNPHRPHAIPDFAGRGDEIENLAASLKQMTEALWARMDAIDHFAADVAHEIKNPLTSLRSAVETALRLQDPEQQRRLMSIIQEDVQRLDRLISDISEVSRLDAALSRAEKETVDLGRMLETLIGVYRDSGKKGQAFLRLQKEPDFDARVQGMADRLVRVFQNLIDNAISFSPPGGTISITLTGNGADVEITVEDDGPGIPKGKEADIFKRFYTQRPEKEKFGTHSGLGLNISQQIVQAHGGAICAKNRPTGGACFVVNLPLK